MKIYGGENNWDAHRWYFIKIRVFDKLFLKTIFKNKKQKTCLNKLFLNELIFIHKFMLLISLLFKFQFIFKNY